MTAQDSAKKKTADEKSENTTREKRRLGFRLAAVCVGLLPFVVLEFTLRAMDVVKPTGYVDPYVGFSKLHPQFEKDEDKGVYETTLSRRLFFGTQQFKIDKPENGYRIFCLGGSTVRGRPYTVDTAFARWMQLELAATDPGHEYEVVNCGGLSYASYRLSAMLGEILEYEPDAIVLATGHNEFLEDRTYQAIKEQSAARRWFGEKLHSLRTVTAARKMWDDLRGKSDQPDGRQQLEDKLKTRLDEESGYASYHRDAESEEWREGVQKHFNVAVRGMVRMCEEAGVPLILVRLGSNLRDCPPFKSEINPDLGEDGREKERDFRSLLAIAKGFEQNDLISNPEDFYFEKTLEFYKEAEAIDDGHALLCYRIARIHDRMGRYEKAREYYLKAKDYDVCPLRMLEPMSQAIETIAEETGTPMVDAKTLLESESPQGIPGHDFYLDHVHPTIGGHQRIARAIVARLRAENFAPAPKAEWTDRQRRDAYRAHIDGLGPTFFVKAAERVKWLENWAQRQRMEDWTRPNDLRGDLHYAERLTNLGKEDAAWREYLVTMQSAPDAVPLIFERTVDLFQQGRDKTATKLLEGLARVLRMQPLNEARFALAVVALETGDTEKARRLVDEHGKSFGDLPEDSAWLKAFPDTRKRLEAL